MGKNLRIMTILSIMAALFATACQKESNTGNGQTNKPEANRTADNSDRSNSNTAVNQAPSESNTATPGDAKQEFSLATPTDAYKTAYEARKNKDVKTLKRVFSKDMLEFFGLLAEDEKSSVDAELMKLAEKPQNPSNQSRNEKITGNTATLEYLDEKGAWKMMDFIKESDGWKLTINPPK